MLAGTQAAFAVNTVSVDGTSTPAGPVTFNGTVPGLFEFETNYGIEGACLLGSSSGYLLRGTSVGIGTKIGAISNLVFGACSLSPLHINIDVSKKSSPSEWTIHLDEMPVKAQRYVKVEIRGINMQARSIAAPGLWTIAFNFAGTLKATIDTSLDQLIINTPTLTMPSDYPLVIDALDAWGDKTGTTDSTFSTQIWDGDLMSVKATFQLDRDIAF